MKTLQLCITVLFLSFGFLSKTHGQSFSDLQRIYKHIEEKYGFSRESIGELQIKSQYLSGHNHVRHVQVSQIMNGVEVFGTGITLTLLPNGKIASLNPRLQKLTASQFNRSAPAVSPDKAILSAVAAFGVTSRSAPSLLHKTSTGTDVYEKGDISRQEIHLKKGYLKVNEDQYKLTYSIYLEPVGSGQSFTCYVDAMSGDLITYDDMILNCQFEHGFLQREPSCLHEESVHTAAPILSGSNGTYHVVPAPYGSPSHGSFQTVTGVDDPIASPFGWHDTNGSAGAEHTDTRGNNVYAFPDRNWDYLPDSQVDGGPGLVFDFPFDANAEPVDNQNVAVTNLFYWSNVMHDFAYKYGFDEAAGNFQDNNYSGEGEDGDYVEAHAQFGDLDPVDCGVQANNDVDCINNADFGLTPDGVNGRMRMFTWDRDNNSKFLEVLAPDELAGKVLTGLPIFGPDIDDNPITGEVVVINDGSFDPTLACEPVTQPELEGKIAMIDRGVCDFSLKVYHAQEAGAIGVIVCNFEDVVIPMGEGEFADEVTIPSVLISSSDCQRLRLEAGTGLVASLVASEETGGPLLRDGSLDNTIIAHEYAHGISDRLTSGPGSTGCLTPGALTGDAEESYGMSEGWSDFFSLAITTRPGDTGEMRRGIGTYANKEETTGRGIRPFPYSTDMSITPYTYDDIVLESIPYGVGAVWCSMIWDMYWALSEVHGWDADIYNGTGGNNIAIQLVMDGLKLQGCNPGFIEARDAILLADEINNGGANQCIIWETFARRGLGFDAYGGDPDSRSDGNEGFDLPPGCLDELRFTKTVTPEIVAGNNIDVKLTVTNFTEEELTNVYIEDFIPEDCIYLEGSANIEPEVGNSLLWSLNSLAKDESVIITYQIKTDRQNFSQLYYYDFIDDQAPTRWNIYSDPNGTSINRWMLQDSITADFNKAFRVGDTFIASEHFLENKESFSVLGENPVYRFYTYYNTETGADGGFLEISTDVHPGWTRLEDQIFRNGYPRKLEYNTFAIPDLSAYSGLSDSNKTMLPVYVDLNEYAGQQAKIRYRFGTNEALGGEGWYVDDIELMDANMYNTQACISSDQTTTFCVEAPERGTIVDTQITYSTEEEETNSLMTITPNPAKDFLQVGLSAIQNQEVVITVYNLTGQLITTALWDVVPGNNQKSISLINFAPGMYAVQVKTTSGMQSKLFIKE